VTVGQAVIVIVPTLAALTDKGPAQRKAAAVDAGVRLEDDEER